MKERQRIKLSHAMRTTFATGACALFLGACSSLPNVEVAYFLPTSTAVISLAQTVDCNVDKSALIIINTPLVTPTYVADIEKRVSINLRAIEGAASLFTDSDAIFKFYDDGRLKSVGQSTHGQTGAFIQSAVQLAATIVPLNLVRNDTFAKPDAIDAQTGNVSKICADIVALGNSKPLALTYASQPIDPLKPVPSADLAPVAASSSLHEKLKSVLPTLSYTVGPFVRSQRRAYVPLEETGTISTRDAVPLTLRDTGKILVTVTITETVGTERKKQELTVDAIVPGTEFYQLPIPKAAFFGKQSFSIALTDFGAITEIAYGKLTGASSAVGAVNAIATDGVGTEAGALKAQADLIAQQQRLARCKSNPAACT